MTRKLHQKKKREQRNESSFPLVSLKTISRDYSYLLVMLLIVIILGVTPNVGDVESQTSDNALSSNIVLDSYLNSSLIPITDTAQITIQSNATPTLNESHLATQWELINHEDEISTVFCYGSAEACALLGLESLTSKWNIQLDLGVGTFNLSLNNTIASRVIYANYALSEEAAFVDIRTSDWSTTSLQFVDVVLEQPAEQNLTQFPESSERPQPTTQIEVNKPVQWIISRENHTASSSFSLPADAVNIRLYQQENDSIEPLPDFFGTIHQNDVKRTLAQFDRDQREQAALKKLGSVGIASTKSPATLIVNTTQKQLAITFETEPPVVTELLSSSFRKKVLISSDSQLEYTNVTSTIAIPEHALPVNLYHIINGTYLLVNNNPDYNVVFNDTDDNGLYDQASWVVPHLSDQYFEFGLATINTNKSVYHPHEHAQLIMVVLDSEGFLVSNAYVEATVTNPLGVETNYSTSRGTISEINSGIYQTTHTDTAWQGNYTLYVSAQAQNVNYSMVSFFTVQEYYPYEIIRNAPASVDPFKGPTTVELTTTSFTSFDEYSVIELVPTTTTIVNASGAVMSSTSRGTELRWDNVANGSRQSYMIQPPLISPGLISLGPTKIIDTVIYQEQKPWLLALDPEAFPEGSDHLATQACFYQTLEATQNNFPTVCGGTYPDVCGAGNDLVSCNDAAVQQAQDSKSGATTLYGGIFVEVYNDTINDCETITSVFLCYEFYCAGCNAGQHVCTVGVDNDGDNTFNETTVTCAGAAGATICMDVTANETWVCSNFFGSAGTRATAKAQAIRTGGSGAVTWDFDQLAYNVTFTDTIPRLNISVNNSAPSFGTVLNVTANVSDLRGLSFCQFFANDTSNGNYLILNKSITGRDDQCSQNFTISLSKGNVINYTVVVNDSSGNINQTTDIIVEVANLAPEQPMILIPTPDQLTRDQPLQFNVTFPADGDGDPITIYYYINGEFNQSNDFNTTFNATSGTYILNVSLSDSTTFGPNASVTFTLDIEPPVVNGTVNSSTVVYGQSINASFNTTDNVALDAAQIIINDTGFIRYFNFSLTDAADTFSQNITVSCVQGCVINVTGRVNDSLGSTSQNETIIEVANTPPSTPTILSPGDSSLVGLQPLHLNVSGFDADNDPINFSYYINGQLNQTSFDNTTFNASDGTYILNVSAFDGLDYSANDSITFTLDTTPPSIRLLSPSNNSFNNSGQVQFVYEISELNSLDVCALYTNFSGVWQENQSNASPITETPTVFNATAVPDGLYVWNVFCNDSTGNGAFNSSNSTIIVDTRPPQLAFAFPTPINNTNTSSTQVIFNVTHTDPYNETLIFSRNRTFPNETMSFGDENYTNLTRTLTHGTYFYYFYVNDSASNINQTEIRVLNVDTIQPNVTLLSPGNSTWNNSAIIDFSYLVEDNFVGAYNCSLLVYGVTNQSNAALDFSSDLTFSAPFTSSFFENWSINCTDHAGNLNISEERVLKIDRSLPRLENQTISSFSVPITTNVCLNVTVNDSFSDVASVLVELDLPSSANVNISLTNNTLDANSCDDLGGLHWSYAYTALEEGEVNWTRTYVQDRATNLNFSATFGHNWSQISPVDLNVTIHDPIIDIIINESEPSINYSFSLICNITCTPDSAQTCNNMVLKPQYFNDSWNDITNLSSELRTNKMNTTCGTLAIDSHCDDEYNVSSSIFSGNSTFQLRCLAQGDNTPITFSTLRPNVTINDHPRANFTFPVSMQQLSGIIIANGSYSSDDRNISNYTFFIDDNPQFLTPTQLCSSNQSNCTIDTSSIAVQSQCVEDTANCYLRLNVTDIDNLGNATFIQIQIDNTAPAVRLELPRNNTFSNSSNVTFSYAAFDTNLSTCTLYHNETGLFAANETNATVRNSSQDDITIVLQDKTMVWNVYCNDTAGNVGFNATNYTLTVDTTFPSILYSNGMPADGEFVPRNYFLINVSINDSNFANLTFFVYNISLDLVNETTYYTVEQFINANTSLNLSNMQDGTYFYNVTVVDKAHNKNVTRTQNVTLDTTSPFGNFSLPTAANNTFTTTSHIAINVTLSESNFANATVYLYDTFFTKINESNISFAFNPTNFSINFTPIADTDERYYYNVTIRDKAGNINTTETRIITIDDANPAVALLTPQNYSLAGNSTVMFNFTAVDSNLFNCTLFANFSGTYAENRSQTSPVSGSVMNITPEPINDGLYVWNVLCYDSAGNYAWNNTNYTVRIDTQPPQSFDLLTPANNTESINSSPLLSWEEAIDPHFLNYTVIVDQSPDFASPDFAYKLGGNYSNTSFAVPDVWPGNRRWYWMVTAFDQLNQSRNATDPFTYIIDNATPVVTLLEPFNHSIRNVSSIDFSFNVSEQHTLSLCALIINDGIVQLTSELTKNVSNTISVTLDNGNYNWSVNCTDGAGNTNTSVFRNITFNAPPLIDTIFVDTEDSDFDQGIFYRTQRTGLDDGANVTLNNTLYSAIENYSMSGNFTSRVYDTGANNTQLDTIQWFGNVPNSSDVMGYAQETDVDDIGVFYRNGSVGVDPDQADLASVIDLRQSMRSYTIPGGNAYDDIAGFAWDDDNDNVIFVFMRDGTVYSDTTQADLTTDIAFTVASTYTLPPGFNHSAIVGFAMFTNGNGPNGQTAVFFNNGSMAFVASEAAPFAFASTTSYTIPGTKSFDDIIGFAYDEDAQDAAVFFRDGTYASDSTQADLISEVNFVTVFAATHQAEQNLTTYANISLQTRVSNDSVTFSSWSPLYVSTERADALFQTEARFIQYRALLSTPDQFITPELENVTINYTDINVPLLNYSPPTPADNAFITTDSFFVNVSITDEHNIIGCTFELDDANQSMILSRDGRNATCTLNVTSVASGVHTYRVYANDSFKNVNSTVSRTITYDPDAPVINTINQIPLNIYNHRNVTFIVNVTDLALSEVVIEANWTNVLGNTSLQLGAGDLYNVTLLQENLSSRELVRYRIFANDTSGNTVVSEYFNFTVNNSVATVSITNPTFEISRYINKTFFVNATITAENGSVDRCILNATYDPGLTIISDTNQTAGFVPNGSTSLVAGWIFNGTTIGTFHVNITSNCSDGDKTQATAPPIFVIDIVSNLSDVFFIELLELNGIEYVHAVTDTAVNWYSNTTHDLITINSTNTTPTWFTTQWLVIINDSAVFDMQNISWDTRRIGVDTATNTTFILNTGRLYDDRIRINMSTSWPAHTQTNNVSISLENIGTLPINNTKLRWVATDFNIGNDGDVDILQFINETNQQENYSMNSGTSIVYNRSNFNDDTIFFADASSNIKGTVLWERNMSVDGVKEPLYNLTFAAGGADFMVNLTFDFGGLEVGQKKMLDPGAGLATPGNIRRTDTLATQTTTEAGTTYTDVTVPLTDNNFNTRDYITTRVGDQVQVFNIVNETEIADFDDIYLLMRIDSTQESPYNIYAYPYNTDNVTVSTAQIDNTTILSTDADTWVRFNITNASHFQDGFGHLRIRLTPEGSAISNNRRLYFDEILFNFTDQTPPAIELVAPVNDFNTTNTSVFFNFTVSDKIDLNISCNVTLDGLVVANFSVLNGTSVNKTLHNISEGNHFWNVSCFDDHGNSNTSVTRNFTIVQAPTAFNATLASDNISIILDWTDSNYAEEFLVYLIDNFTIPFDTIANVTGILDSNYTDSTVENKTERFYRVAVRKGSLVENSTIIVGKIAIPFVNNSDQITDFNLFSLPLNITNFELENGTNNGYDLATKPIFCMQALWSYNATLEEFKRTDYNGTAWNRALGSENFTHLRPGEGYWAQVNQTCNVTFVGQVPTLNITVPLESGWNIVGWYSPNKTSLPNNYAPPYPVVVEPQSSVQLIARYDPFYNPLNPIDTGFEIIMHFVDGVVDWGWFPSFEDPQFTGLDPGLGYYYDATQAATWEHQPNTKKDES